MASIGDKIDALYDLKNRKDDLDEQLKSLNKQIDALEFEVLNELENMGTDSCKTPKATATRKVDMYPQVTDMSALLEWAVANDRPDMIQKRVSSASFKEYLEATGAFPDGVDAYSKATLLFRRSK